LNSYTNRLRNPIGGHIPLDEIHSTSLEFPRISPSLIEGKQHKKNQFERWKQIFQINTQKQNLLEKEENVANTK
jgi:hypothetical protein